jgi:glycosyltransferase involved in cell wall biosynthesis
MFIISEEQRYIFRCKKKIFKIHTVINNKLSYLQPRLIDNRSKYILYLGRINKDKGIDDLIEAMRLFNNYNSSVELKIVGPIDSIYRKEIINKIEKYGLVEKIKLFPPVYSIEKKIEIIDNCLFGVYPSYKDAFPITVIEFFSRRKICIATNIAETKNFINYDKFLVKPGDINDIKNKIINLLNNNYDDSVLENIYKKALKYSNGEIINDFKKYGVI